MVPSIMIMVELSSLDRLLKWDIFSAQPGLVICALHANTVIGVDRAVESFVWAEDSPKRGPIQGIQCNGDQMLGPSSPWAPDDLLISPLSGLVDLFKAMTLCGLANKYQLITQAWGRFTSKQQN